MPQFKRREPAPDVAQLRQECREFIRQLELTEPDEDWIPTVIYYGKDGPGMAALFVDAGDISQTLEHVLEENQVTAWGFWSTTWMDYARDVEAPPGTRSAEYPSGFEALFLRLHTVDKSALEIARIERHEDAPPTIGEWEVLAEKEWEIQQEG